MYTCTRRSNLPRCNSFQFHPDYSRSNLALASPMASAVAKIRLLMPVVVPGLVGLAGFVAWKLDWAGVAQSLLAKEGRTRRVFIVASVLLNLKCLPLAWTVGLQCVLVLLSCLLTDVHCRPEYGTLSCTTSRLDRRPRCLPERSLRPS